MNLLITVMLQVISKEIITYTDTIKSQEQEISCLKIYKEMYLTLLDKLISAKGGAASDQAGIL